MIPEVLQRLTCQALLAVDLAVQFQCLQSVFAKRITETEFFYSHVAISFVYRGPVLSLRLSLAFIRDLFMVSTYRLLNGCSLSVMRAADIFDTITV